MSSKIATAVFLIAGIVLIVIGVVELAARHGVWNLIPLIAGIVLASLGGITLIRKGRGDSGRA